MNKVNIETLEKGVELGLLVRTSCCEDKSHTQSYFSAATAAAFLADVPAEDHTEALSQLSIGLMKACQTVISDPDFIADVNENGVPRRLSFSASRIKISTKEGVEPEVNTPIDILVEPVHLRDETAPPSIMIFLESEDFVIGNAVNDELLAEMNAGEVQ